MDIAGACSAAKEARDSGWNYMLLLLPSTLLAFRSRVVPPAGGKQVAMRQADVHANASCPTLSAFVSKEGFGLVILSRRRAKYRKDCVRDTEFGERTFVTRTFPDKRQDEKG